VNKELFLTHLVTTKHLSGSRVGNIEGKGWIGFRKRGEKEKK
jgi:hypothetical protein